MPSRISFRPVRSQYLHQFWRFPESESLRLPLTWQTPEDLAAGERRMHEQTNKCILCLLVDVLEQPGQRQQMVVVDPDEITRLPDAREFFSKRFIGLEVSFPVRLFRRNLSCDVLPEKVVENRPKC